MIYLRYLKETDEESIVGGENQCVSGDGEAADVMVTVSV
jgi:hypothetical protein